MASNNFREGKRGVSDPARTPAVRAFLLAFLLLLVVVASYLAPLFGYDPFGDTSKQLYDRYPRPVASAVLAAAAWYTWFCWKDYRDTRNPVSFSWLATMVVALLLFAAWCIGYFMVNAGQNAI